MPYESSALLFYLWGHQIDVVDSIVEITPSCKGDRAIGKSYHHPLGVEPRDPPLIGWVLSQLSYRLGRLVNDEGTTSPSDGLPSHNILLHVYINAFDLIESLLI